MLLDFIIDDNGFRCINETEIANTTSLNYLKCHFTFKAKAWQDLDAVVAIFKSATYNKVAEVVLDSDNCCYIEPEVYRRGGTIQVKVVGDKYISDNVISTTHISNITTFKIKETIIFPTPTPSKYEIVVSELANARSAVYAAIAEFYQKAEDGEFDGADGIGIETVSFNADGTVNVILQDGRVFTSSESMKGPVGETPNFSVGSVVTLPSGSNATVSLSGTTSDPILNFGIPAGSDGSGLENLYDGSADGSVRTSTSREESEYPAGTALGIGAVAEGIETIASGDASHAEGSYYEDYDENVNPSTASGYASHAEGAGTLASGYASHAEGESFLDEGTEYRVTASGDGSHAEGGGTTASGKYAHSEGHMTVASGSNSHAEGSITTASGINSHAEGAFSTASSDGAHAEGFSAVASGAYSHAEGYQTEASGLASHAEGYGTEATKQYAHAEGFQTTASGYYSHAEGASTTASGDNSHAEGSNSTASGDSSHAEGTGTASGSCSHAEGGGTTASGKYAHSEGLRTIAKNASQHVFGEYNAEDPSTASATAKGNYVEIVGNGTAVDARSNARTLDWSGNEALAGSLTLGLGTANEVTITAAQLTQLLALLQ